MLCVYYNESETKNKNHFENHDRINVSIKYIKENIKNITIYNNNTILNYLQSELKMGSKEEIFKLLCNSSDSMIYSDEYMLDIKTKCSKLKDNEIISGDTYFSNVTYNEILDNSVIMYNVCYQININRIRYAYCLIRPPSHHSSLNQYSGFCIVNHTYLTAKHLHDMYKKKVLILDYDVHHGDGTQKLVKSHMKDNIYFISIHCYGDGFYPGTGNIDENNMKVLNIPMKKGSKNKEYIHNFNKVKKFISSHDIDIIVVSNGVDAHKDDPFKTMKLTNKFYTYVTSYLKSLDKPLIYILEGGYNPDVIGNVSVDIINTLQTKEEEKYYYLHVCPSDPYEYFCTAKTINNSVEIEPIQYKFKPELLKNLNIDKYLKINITKKHIKENRIWTVEVNCEENLKKLLPSTQININDWNILLVIQRKVDNIICLKGAIYNNITKLIALMTSINSKDYIENKNNYAINSHHDGWFVSDYRMEAPFRFWHDLKYILENNIKDNTQYYDIQYNTDNINSLYKSINAEYMSMLEAKDEYEKEQNLITQSFNVHEEQSSSVSLKDNKSFNVHEEQSSSVSLKDNKSFNVQPICSKCSVIINNENMKQLKYDNWCNYSNIIISLLVIVIIIMFYIK
jgi:acetoin utilization deacetylase AcuC-like enzyme